MGRTVGLGKQDFENVRIRNCFYVDKTDFIQEWWENEDDVTLITRPRRFGKTLNMSMVEKFFSVEYKGAGSQLFGGLSIWKEDKYRELQGTWPVISLSFAGVKGADFLTAREKICQIIMRLYSRHRYLLSCGLLDEKEKAYFARISEKMSDADASSSINFLGEFLFRYYGKKPLILLDEYDTPLQEAYVGGYWDELADFIRSLFNETFKTNDYYERALLTGITRVSTPKASLGKESIFSDLNNLEVVTTTSGKYAASFGFTENEVYAALEEYGISDRKAEVKLWYDGFTFGTVSEIYNPWSILNYLDKKVLAPYWANTSSNNLVGKLIRAGSAEIKIDFEELLKGNTVTKKIEEQIVFDQLTENEAAVWSLLLAGGYLKVKKYVLNPRTGRDSYQLALTNMEVRIMFEKMIGSWFGKTDSGYNSFIKAFLKNDLKAMNAYMNRVALATFSYFDGGTHPSDYTEPERFYHGFVLGLMVELSDRYTLISNRESGFGRYDVLLEPKNGTDCDAMILEFKVFDPEEEKTLEETARRALAQINSMKYAVTLMEKGIPAERIRKYGFAFCGKKVLIKYEG